MVISRGQGSLNYPGSPISQWIIGERVEIVAAVGSADLGTYAYVCGKTQVEGMLGLYDALVLRCSPLDQILPPPTEPPETGNLKVIYVRWN